MQPRPPLRIAILECDTPLPNTKARFGSYGGVFEQLLKGGARALNGSNPEHDTDSLFHITKHQIEIDPEGYPRLEDVDAILITGSRHDSFSDAPWILKLVEYTTQVLAQDRVRVIGVCFGHQIVGRAMGVKVGRNDAGWEAAVNEVQLSEKGKEVFRREKLDIHQMHRDMVYYYPPGVEALGSSPVCKVQGMYVAKRLLTVQGHPEFNQEIMDEIIETRHATGIFDDEAYATHMKKVPLHHDGLVVSQAFLRFLSEQ